MCGVLCCEVSSCLRALQLYFTFATTPPCFWRPRRAVCLLVPDCVWQCCMTVNEQNNGRSKREREEDGGGSSRTYCGSAVPLGCGSAKDRLRILAVTQQPHNSGLALIDFTPPVLWSDRVLCGLAGPLDLQASAASLKPRIWFQTWLMHQNQTHDQCFTTAFNQRLWLQVKLSLC